MLAITQARSPRTVLSLLAVAVLLTLLGAAPRAASAASASAGYRPDELIVRLAPGVGIDELNASLGTTTISQYPSGGTYLLRTPPGVDPAGLAEALVFDLRLVFASPNYIGRAPEANPRGIGAWGGYDPAPMRAQSALAQVGLAAAQQLSRGGGVTLAIIDTGAQLDHPDLVDSLAPGGYDFIDNDADPTDLPDGIDNNQNGVTDEAYGHGTHVAGIVHLVAPEARLLILRALDAEGESDVFVVAQAIDYAVSQGASVINLSLGTFERTRLLEHSVQLATQAGVVVVASAGNEDSDIKQYPAATGCAIAVTSVDAEDRRSLFANYGSWIGVAAPGESIFSAFPGGGYASWSGTSMATPFVAGEAALIRALRPSLDVRLVASIIGRTAHGIDMQNPLYAGQLGDGRVNLAAAVRLAASGFEPRAQRSRISGSCVEAGAV